MPVSSTSLSIRRSSPRSSARAASSAGTCPSPPILRAWSRPAPLARPLLPPLPSPGRERRRQVPLSAIPPRMVQAVLAIEDRRFYDHPGVDLIRTIGAVWTNLFGKRRYLEGGSTITQQLVKNTFLTQ